MTQEQGILIQKDGSVATLIINRPEKANALTSSALLGMVEVMRELEKENAVRCVVIRGAGEKAFSAGYDIGSLPVNPGAEAEDALKETPPLERALQAIHAFPYPVIAMLNGYAYGGACELAMGCDIRIAARRVKMGVPSSKLGLVYPYAGLRRFVRILGFPRTLEILLTGRTYDSEACLRMGLVNHVVDDDQVEAFTYDLAKEISGNAPLSLRGVKKALYKIAQYPLIPQEEEMALGGLFIQSLRSEDMAEARMAFLEKRRPAFKGK